MLGFCLILNIPVAHAGGRKVAIIGTMVGGGGGGGTQYTFISLKLTT